MKRSEIHRIILHEMKSIFYSSNQEYIDWMGYKITEINKPSYHHIEKVEDLKEKNESSIANVENGAYLGKKSHEILHQIEHLDKELYECWNYLFRVINNMKTYPIDDVWNMVYKLQDKTEEVIKSR